MNFIDTAFDFQLEAGKDKNGIERDSDKYSPTLQEYHRALWSRPLPSGQLFELKKISGNKLLHQSDLGTYTLSSDWGAVTLSGRQNVKKYLSEVDREQLREFQRLVITIGARIVWPSNRIDGRSTINGAKGMNYLVADRLDLTLECIRRYYRGEQSPLGETLKAYATFFALFENFQEYVDFFLLQDYVSSDYQTVRVAQPYNDFSSSPIPINPTDYSIYADTTMGFIRARNDRIASIKIRENDNA